MNLRTTLPLFLLAGCLGAPPFIGADAGVDPDADGTDDGPRADTITVDVRDPAVPNMPLADAAVFTIDDAGVVASARTDNAGHAVVPLAARGTLFVATTTLARKEITVLGAVEPGDAMSIGAFAPPPSDRGTVTLTIRGGGAQGIWAAYTRCGSGVSQPGGEVIPLLIATECRSGPLEVLALGSSTKGVTHVARGTATAARGIGRPAAGKTGTTNDNTDAWFIGFTGRVLAATWLGFDDPSKKLGREGDGAHAALPLWMRAVREAEGARPDVAVPGIAPPGLERVTIDRESGLLAAPGAPGLPVWFRTGTAPVEVSGQPGTSPTDFGRSAREF